MVLNRKGIEDRSAWKGYRLPEFDIEKMRAKTAENPVWLHFGSGNIFRAFLCSAAQSLLNNGTLEAGIVAAESHGTEIITECYRPHDDLCVNVTLNPDGTTDKEVLASVGESLTTEYDFARIAEIFDKPSLQMVSFTITEKGYALADAKGNMFPTVTADMASSPDEILADMKRRAEGPDHSVTAHHLMAVIASLTIMRGRNSGTPLALVSMDNCSHNGEKIEKAVIGIAEGWFKAGKITSADLAYLKDKVSYPWSMIDKITPRPDSKVEEELAKDGIDDIRPFVTPNGTYIAAFVNAEKPQYLIVEDDFPNGRPALDKARGVIFTDRDTVNKTERMKVCTCLNPLHTALAIFGCLLGFTSIAAEMKDRELRTLIDKMSAKEGMPVVENPGIIDPKDFLRECLEERFPNPFMPDTPQRIATDTSQKLPIRYGENFKAHIEKGDATDLVFMPLVIAGWLRYLLGVNDAGETFEPSSDPMLATAQELLGSVSFGKPATESELEQILRNETFFGTDLVAAGLLPKITGYFNELNASKGSVRSTLKKYTV